MTTLILVSGIPRAGKSSLCDAVEASGAGFTHVPLDRYVRPVPPSLTFLEWIATPACIAWEHLRSHIAMLEAGVPCYSPRPNWEQGWREWISDGGALETAPGRRMEPAHIGYLVAGTHAFAFAEHDDAPMRVFVETGEEVVAERLTGRRVDRLRAGVLIRERLAANIDVILGQACIADWIIDGTADRRTQVHRFLTCYARFVARHNAAARFVARAE